MKGIDALKNKCLLAIFSFMLVRDIWRKTLIIIELTKLAKISCKVFSYGAIPDPFLGLRSSNMDQMKRIDATKNQMTGSNLGVPGDHRYVKKTSDWVD